MLGVNDLLSGQCSLPAQLFRRLGGFDLDFTRNGAFGDEDLDFGTRLLGQGCRIVFNAGAISWQRYVVTPRAYLRQYRQAGRADVVFARKHPQLAPALFATHRPDDPVNRYLCRPLAAVPGLGRGVAALARGGVIALARLFPRSGRLERMFVRVVDLQYWKGVHEGGRDPPSPARAHPRLPRDRRPQRCRESRALWHSPGGVPAAAPAAASGSASVSFPRANSCAISTAMPACRAVRCC